MVLEFWFGHSKCHFFWSENGHFCQKCQSLRPKKWHFEWPNQNSKTTFIVQTFPKYGPYGFDLVNLSLLGAILAIFQFCGFSGLFWPFFPCKKCKNENLSPHFNFWSITLKFFLWTPTTHEPEWLRELSSIQKKCKNGTPYYIVYSQRLKRHPVASMLYPYTAKQHWKWNWLI